jgi:hypothetical protein
MDGSTSSEEEASIQSEFDSLDGQFSSENGDEDEDPASIRADKDSQRLHVARGRQSVRSISRTESSTRM